MTDRDRNVIVTLEDGSKLGFRFDHWVFLQTQRKTQSKGMIDMFQKIGFDDANIDLTSFTILLVESINEYHFFNGDNTVIDERSASRYIDLMGGTIKAMEKISEGFAQYIPKNSEPPVETGEMISQ
jgi:hypothetical protein